MKTETVTISLTRYECLIEEVQTLHNTIEDFKKGSVIKSDYDNIGCSNTYYKDGNSLESELISQNKYLDISVNQLRKEIITFKKSIFYTLFKKFN